MSAQEQAGPPARAPRWEPVALPAGAGAGSRAPAADHPGPPTGEPTPRRPGSGALRAPRRDSGTSFAFDRPGGRRARGAPPRHERVPVRGRRRRRPRAGAEAAADRPRGCAPVLHGRGPRAHDLHLIRGGSWPRHRRAATGIRPWPASTIARGPLPAGGGGRNLQFAGLEPAHGSSIRSGDRQGTRLLPRAASRSPRASPTRR